MLSKGYSKPCQTSKVELYVKIVNGWKKAPSYPSNYSEKGAIEPTDFQLILVLFMWIITHKRESLDRK